MLRVIIVHDRFPGLAIHISLSTQRATATQLGLSGVEDKTTLLTLCLKFHAVCDGSWNWIFKKGFRIRILDLISTVTIQFCLDPMHLNNLSFSIPAFENPRKYGSPSLSCMLLLVSVDCSVSNCGGGIRKFTAETDDLHGLHTDLKLRKSFTVWIWLEIKSRRSAGVSDQPLSPIVRRREIRRNRWKNRTKITKP